jgi:hypothetical protein
MMKTMEKDNKNYSKIFGPAIEEMSKDINRLNEEKAKNVAFKGKVLGEMLEKIKQSVSEIE